MFGEDVLILSVSRPSPTLTASPRACAQGGSRIAAAAGDRVLLLFAINLTEDGGESGPDPVASARAGAGNIRADAEMNAHTSTA